MGRRYKNPPIIEALCDIRLSEDTRWDLTVPGMFYEKIRRDYPEREQRLIPESWSSEEPQSLKYRVRATERILFFVPDRKRLVQLGPRLLIINVLKPYPGWEEFKPRLEEVWQSLQQVVDVHGIERIGLRYLNRIELQSEQVSLEEYLEFYPYVGARLPQRLVSFISGVEFSDADGRDHCRVQLTPEALEDSKFVVMLDIDYFLARPGAVEAANVLDWVEEAHTRVEEIFEGCITDKLRGIFERDS